MKHYSDLEYLKLSKGKKLGYRVASFFTGIPKAIWNFIKKIGNALKGAGLKVADEAKDIVGTFIKGDWKTKVSYLIMGFGCLARGQILRGLLFLLFEIVFVGYMVLYGVYWLRMLPSLGTVCPHE
jgi:arabinogalactan oligomer/maltooligosaccharide transport system permease protein